MSKITDVRAIKTAIYGGEVDTELDEITDAIQGRKEMLNNAKARTLNVGDRIRFNNSVRPRYLAGSEGVVTGWKRTKIQIRPDDALGRFHGGDINCPVSILDKIV